ncbi:uncharacterized protein SEPMUDRAFT_107061 [Sphaerulina musiva SO2202]|uniref:Uncharacterized protein n=1 Tax=Sphaerulina musiva (strain SO2202) TaxID=692275 RepID=M3DA83_SPHMS|nr:uncharacterized protein SEPMUDRAFT_107061 [Sphaerulina musiva SO2202]EMF14789.1 hypothetical protein SEPMUDRAFT_107061 [Sphaerulina musiva SO2202]
METGERGSSYVGRVEAPNDAYLELGKNTLLATSTTPIPECPTRSNPYRHETAQRAETSQYIPTKILAIIYDSAAVRWPNGKASDYDSHHVLYADEMRGDLPESFSSIDSIVGGMSYIVRQQAKCHLSPCMETGERGSSYVGRVEAPNDAYLELGKNTLLATSTTPIPECPTRSNPYRHETAQRAETSQYIPTKILAIIYDSAAVSPIK